MATFWVPPCSKGAHLWMTKLCSSLIAWTDVSSCAQICAYRIFKEVDVDGSGDISVVEFKHALESGALTPLTLVKDSTGSTACHVAAQRNNQIAGELLSASLLLHQTFPIVLNFGPYRLHSKTRTSFLIPFLSQSNFLPNTYPTF
jgi:hypothetical protein